MMAPDSLVKPKHHSSNLSSQTDLQLPDLKTIDLQLLDLQLLDLQLLDSSWMGWIIHYRMWQDREVDRPE